MLVVGGGSYTLRNVPHCWTFETSILTGEKIKDGLPFNDYFEYVGPGYHLHLPVSIMDNLNSVAYLDKTKNQLLEILAEVEPAPGVQIQMGQVDSALHPAPMDVDESAAADESHDPNMPPMDTGRKEHPAELVTNEKQA